MTKIRVNHYGAKTIGIGTTVDWESLLAEALISFLLAVFAYMGYVGNIALLFFPCALGAVLCFCVFLHTIFLTLKEKRESRKAQIVFENGKA